MSIFLKAPVFCEAMHEPFLFLSFCADRPLCKWNSSEFYRG